MNPETSHTDVAVAAVNAFNFIFRLLRIKTFPKNLQNIHNYGNTFIKISLRKIDLLDKIVAPRIADIAPVHLNIIVVSDHHRLKHQLVLIRLKNPILILCKLIFKRRSRPVPEKQNLVSDPLDVMPLRRNKDLPLLAHAIDLPPRVIDVCGAPHLMDITPFEHLVPHLLMLRDVEAVHEIGEPGAEQEFEHIRDRDYGFGFRPGHQNRTSKELCDNLIAHQIPVKSLPDQFDLLK